MKKRFWAFLREMVPVMIGVYLGFLVSNWGENRKNAAQARVLITNLQSEISANKAWLTGILDYHAMLRDSSNIYAYKEEIKLEPPRYFKGVNLEPLLSSAFKTGIQTGAINELPLDLIQELNQLYTYQDSYNNFASIVVNGLINMDFYAEEANLRKIARFLGVTMTDIVIKEKQLLEKYDQITEVLNKKN